MSKPQESQVAELTVRVIILGVVLSIVMGTLSLGWLIAGDKTFCLEKLTRQHLI